MNYGKLLAACAAISLLATTARAENTEVSTRALVCDHVRPAMPTPAPLSIATVGGDILFECPGGDSQLGGLVYTMRDAAELAYWRDNMPERHIDPGEEDGEN